MRIAVGIATAGRPETLNATLRYVSNQSRLPEHIFICAAAADDVDASGWQNLNCAIDVVSGARGLTNQRNAIIEAARAADVLIFLDDDFFLADDFIATAEALFSAHHNIVVATGNVLADGIHSAGLSEQAAALLLRSAAVQTNESLTDVYNAYGCNMLLRMAPVIAHNIRFDAVLPLYGWLEDLDFCRGLAPYGRIVKSNKLRGVHLGVKRGRNSGVRFGYSQVANPLYIAAKGSLGPHRALTQIIKNMAMNAIKLRNPEPWIDRRGRVKGNFLALGDLLRRRLSPGRILDLE